MKTHIKTILFAIIFAMTVQQNYSQEKVDLDLIIGTWTFDYETALSSMDEKAKSHYSKMNINRRSQLENLYRNRKLTFLKNGTYVQVVADGRQRTGTWNVKGKILVLTNADDIYCDYNILELSASKISIKPIISGKTQPLLTILHFVKS